ncbi:ABC transporter substrate-binding protein [Aminobacter sp. MSH1]|uniref:ABC transporter substrate-binding protein n=1 Tax=Aminobacter sp. MSH1 TaxID=374606 RepID=UPI000D350948|nr:ABC transporter substrate-binding protein [Aminobacter sp. MSH1]
MKNWALTTAAFAVSIALGLHAPTQALAKDASTFIVATKLVDSKFDPALHNSEFDSMDIINLYEPLVYAEVGGALRMALAESIEASADGLVWTVKLRPNAIFHDGAPVRAQDVVYSMDRMLTINKGYAFLWNSILKPGDIKATDDLTVEFHLATPFGAFQETLVQFFVVNSNLMKANTLPEGLYGENGDYGTGYLQAQEAGSGPYRLENFVPDSMRTFVKFADYPRGWSEDQYERVMVQIIAETATAQGLLLNGEIDMIDQWQPVELYTNLKAGGEVDVVETPDAKLLVMQMNNQKPPLDDVNFRKAISYAFDYETAVNVIMGGAELAKGPIPSLLPGHSDTVEPYTLNLELAREYLSKSKYRPDEFELTYSYLKVATNEQIGLLMQASLSALGIKVKLVPEQWPTLVSMASQAATTPHFFAAYNAAKYPSADLYTYGMYHPKSAGSWFAASWYQSPETTNVIDKARTTIDMAERNQLYSDAATMINSDAASIFVAYPMHRIAKAKTVGGYAYKGIIGFDLNVYDLRRVAP